MSDMTGQHDSVETSEITPDLKWTSMYAAIAAQGDLLRGFVTSMLEDVRHALPAKRPSRIYLVGCGDSYYSGLATKHAIASWTNAPVEAVESLEFSRYEIQFAPTDALVVAVSNSGEVSRTIECVRYARQKGLTTFGITRQPESRLAQSCESVLTYSFPDFGFAPGTISYTASTVALLLTGLWISQSTGFISLDDVARSAARIGKLGDVVDATREACSDIAEATGGNLNDGTGVFFLGGGPNYGTALFSAAKMIESSLHNAVGQELEEWAHEQYFCTGAQTLTVVLAPPGAAIDRARELLTAVRDIGGIAAVVCDSDDDVTRSIADITFPVVGQVTELLSPLVYCIASELIAYQYASSNQKVMFGFDDPVRRVVNHRQIYQSAIPSSAPSLE